MPSRHGGTLRLELRASDPSGASYALELKTSSGEWRALVNLKIDGKVSFSEWSAPEPPSYLATAAGAILRTLLRDLKAAEGRAWPRRIQRWRPEPNSRKVSG